jgi:hypothetical protein
MNPPRWAAWLAIALWVVTAGAAAALFVRGRTAPGEDGRTVVLLAPAERDLVLTEMRGMLTAVQGVVDGLARDDLALVATSARGAGMAHAVDANPELMARLPLEFKQLGMSVHQGMDELADAAQLGEPAAALLQRTGAQLAKCNACHAAWRLPAQVVRP